MCKVAGEGLRLQQRPAGNAMNWLGGALCRRLSPPKVCLPVLSVGHRGHGTQQPPTRGHVLGHWGRNHWGSKVTAGVAVYLSGWGWEVTHMATHNGIIPCGSMPVPHAWECLLHMPGCMEGGYLSPPPMGFLQWVGHWEVGVQKIRCRYRNNTWWRTETHTHQHKGRTCCPRQGRSWKGPPSPVLLWVGGVCSV